MKTGVLAFHGDFAEHMEVLRVLEAEGMEVRTIEDLFQTDRLIIPGGESTVISKFLEMTGLDKELKRKAAKGFPVFGTCAGSIVLAKRITGGPGAKPLGLIDIDVDRNAYGTQIQSFEADLSVKGLERDLKASFIRAPVITRTGKDVHVLATHGGKPVIVRQGNIVVATCHPEMRGETALHRLFLRLQAL